MAKAFDLSSRLIERQAAALYRHRRIIDGAQDVLVQSGGRELLNFCSNDYLGLASDPRLSEAMGRAVSTYGAGAGASHLVCGHSHAHHALEEELAETVGRERALLFSSGWLANLGCITALVQTGDVVLEDRLNHASLLDGALLSGARLRRFAHRSVDGLATQLAEVSETQQALVVTDGVFSMDGDIAPLAEMADVSARHQAMLMVDDAHGFGVFGERGEGVAGAMSADQVPILMATLGKALGTQGAFVAGSAELIETLIQFARSYIYTTGISPAVAEVTREALKLSRQESWRRAHLRQLIAYWQTGLLSRGLPASVSSSPIQPLIVGSPERALSLSHYLDTKGLWVSAIRPPTVPQGEARLRVTFSARHSFAQVDRLLDALREGWGHADQ